MFKMELISVAIYLTNCVLSGIYTVGFLKNKYGEKVTLAIWGIIYFIVQVAVIELLDSKYGINDIVKILINIATLFLMHTILFKKDISKQIFVLLSFMAGKEIVKYIVSVAGTALCELMGAITNTLIVNGIIDTIEKTKLIISIFLLFMWVCTIISRSRYVSELTFVKTEQPSAKYIEHIVEVDGIVTGGSEIAINVLSGLRVDKIYVSQGDSVKEGDVLFTVDLDDLQDIISEKESELAKLKLQLADTDYNNAIASQEKEISILWAQEDYENADSDTQVAVDRAFEDYKKAYEELQEHMASQVPVTSEGE